MLSGASSAEQSVKKRDGELSPVEGLLSQRAQGAPMTNTSMPTAEFRDLWLPPVERATELPPRAEEGQLCFVQGDGRVFLFWNGEWQHQPKMKK
jgi:hypothetical protein